MFRAMFSKTAVHQRESAGINWDQLGSIGLEAMLLLDSPMALEKRNQEPVDQLPEQ